MLQAAILLLFFLTKWMVQLLSSKADSHSAGHFPVFPETPNFSDVFTRPRPAENVPNQQKPQILLWFHKLHNTLLDIRLRPWCEVFVLQGCYAVLIGICLLMFQDGLSWSVKMGPIECPEKSVTNYQSTLCQFPEKPRPSYGQMVWSHIVQELPSKAVFLNRRAAARYRALASITVRRERPEEITICYKISLVQLITNLNVILYLSTCHTVYISVLILFMIMP